MNGRKARECREWAKQFAAELYADQVDLKEETRRIYKVTKKCETRGL